MNVSSRGLDKEGKLCFTIADTNLVKGVATILLLTHHLFVERPDVGPFIAGVSITHTIALISKVCVAMFVFLSGYGLSLSFRKEPLLIFWKKRFVRLFLNYWLIWIIFVPVGVLIFHRSLLEAYGDQILIKLFLNLFGLQIFFGYYGYNATWWFVSLIIALYIVFPLVKNVIDVLGLVGVLIWIPFLLVDVTVVDKVISINFVLIWLLPFALGIYFANKNMLVTTRSMLNGSHTQQAIKFCLYSASLLFVVYQRQKDLVHIGARIDSILAVLLILIIFEYVSDIEYLNQFLELLGKHSLNIFLFHTFIYYYFFGNFFLVNQNPLTTLPLLLFCCLLISIAIERLKNTIGFYPFTQKLLEVGSKKPA